MSDKPPSSIEFRRGAVIRFHWRSKGELELGKSELAVLAKNLGAITEEFARELIENGGQILEEDSPINEQQ